MKRLFALWEVYLNSGSGHFSTPTDLRFNRVLNLLFSLNFLANIFLILAELALLPIMLLMDYDKYIKYLVPFAVLNTVYPLIITVTIWLKNRTGSFRVTYISTLTYTIYVFVLCLYLGERVGIHLILLILMPVAFILYTYGNWRDLFVHAGIMLFGIIASLLSYKLMPPLFPLPANLQEIAGYLTWVAALGLLFIYSIFNWKQVHLTENLLASEKYHTAALLKETIPKLEIAEAKYRHLVDDSADLIFQMSEDGIISSMNKTAKSLLGFNPEEMIGRTLYEFVPDGFEGDPELNRNIVREHLRDFLETKTIVAFRTSLRKKHMYEPIDVQISLQKNLIHWQVEIVGKISRTNEDVSQRFLDKEKGRYIITNNITQAEILSQKLTERLLRYFPATVVSTVRICFREILINAIEHGNLGITFDEKTAAIEHQDYMVFLLERQKDPKYANRQVYVDYLINGRVLIFRVTDEGAGFDHKAFLSRAKDDPFLAMLEHGRGIIMTRNVFDGVVYNDKGNQVILTKKIPQ